MNENLIVLVHVEYQTESKGITNKYSTGYYIRPDIILTTLHVFQNDNLKRLRVRNQKSGSWFNAKKIWQNYSLDSALLQTSNANTSFELVSFNEESLLESVKWSSTAYPKASSEIKENIEYRSSVGLLGNITPFGGKGQNANFLDLTVISPPQNIENWKGISGAPIFANNKLYGIIKSVPESFTDRLKGISIIDLLKDSGFRAAIANKKFEIPSQDDWVLIINSESNKQKELNEYVEGAVKELKLTEEEAYSNFEVRSFNLLDILSSPSDFLRFIKLICVAPIAIIDVTGFQPGIMLLLGIRAVAKKGITITTTFQVISSKNLSELPFNIQEIKLISLDERSDSILTSLPPKDKIIIAIKEGSIQIKKNPNYLDLPTYFAVRNPIVSDIPSIKNKVLFLCSFNESYNEKLKFVYNKLVNYIGPSKNLVRMLDIISPQLVGQSLYEHIRWTDKCVVDWSLWRPNVFYELGVRIASSDLGPINLLEKKELEEGLKTEYKAQKKLLLNLFDPFIYSVSDEERYFPEGVKNFVKFLNGDHDAIPPQFKLTKLYHNQVYFVVEEFFDWAQEKLTIPIHVLTRMQIERDVGKDIETEGKLNILFSANFEFKRKIQNHIKEKWLSAWFYFRHRTAYHEFEQDKDKRKELIELGENVLEFLDPDRDSRVFNDIITDIDNLENL